MAAEAAAHPEDFGLEQNYSNLFNSSTEIGYTQVEAADVEMSVYDLAGQKVVRLVGEFAGSGSHRVAWDGRDDAGRELASGVYIYSLRVGNRSEARKLLLLR